MIAFTINIITKTVPAYALLVGNPARQMGWMRHNVLPLEVFQPWENGELYW